MTNTQHANGRTTRRRACCRCGARFTTHEVIEQDDVAIAAKVRRALPELYDALENLAEIVKR